MTAGAVAEDIARQSFASSWGERNQARTKRRGGISQECSGAVSRCV
jgi:hypothetical protein